MISGPGQVAESVATKVQSRYVCQSCGYASARWVGKCPSCEGWNTLAEEVVDRAAQRRSHPGNRHFPTPVPLKDIDIHEEHRISSGVEEFDRVLGGGIVIGSLVLLGGDPGVGKSTLMMQVASRLKGRIVLFISGEESPRQIKLRAERLAFPLAENILLLSETNTELISELIDRTPPDLIVIDSIQTMMLPTLESAPGSVGQVRESTAVFMKMAKNKGSSIFLIGHVTKEGMIAGPKVIEHMVDTVLHFEGDRHYSYRVLRAMKNRFGSTNEIGVFDMREDGLREVKNPSEVFLSERSVGSSGSTVVASIEGTRPILLEVQALVTKSSYGVPQRNSTGIDYRRLNLLVAVLEKRLGLLLGQFDIFVNIAGGLRVDEPAVDLGVAISIVSSLREIPVDSHSVAIGEVGLGGEVRAVGDIEKRVQEACKLGFTRIVLPSNNLKLIKRQSAVELIPVEKIEDAVKALLQ